MQLLGVSEALAVEYLPGPQDVQAAVPCASEKVPGEQSLHATCDTAAAAPENLPVSQSVQVEILVAAVAPEYLPAMQSVHAAILVAAIVPE
jgi:hypothetical protein